ncbi:MAG: hypothetical protein P8R43_00300, partial [Planctomycetota bacterium]|nr:hypothetical protein [Planctomycetota bacterium]
RRMRWLGTFLAGVTLGATLGWVSSEPDPPAAELGPGLTDAAPGSPTRLAAAAGGRTAGPLHEGPQRPDRGAAEVIASAAVPVLAAQGASSQEVVSVSAAGPLPSPGAGAADAAPVKRLPVLLGDLATLSATPLDGTTVCAYRGAGLGSAELQFVLGGCFGERLSDGAGVLATDRVLGVACCKHHAAVQRLRRPTAGARALDIARQEAELAVQEGFLPPMLELRAERAGILFARHLAGEWRASGFDGAVEGRVHRWAQLGAPGVPAQDQPVRVELRSWIERGEDGGLACYRLVTELGRDAVEDRALSFEWLD